MDKPRRIRTSIIFFKLSSNLIVTFGYDHQITKESQDIGSQISVDLSKQDQPDQAYAGQHFFRSSDTKQHYKATPPLYASFPLIHFSNGSHSLDTSSTPFPKSFSRYSNCSYHHRLSTTNERTTCSSL